MLTVRINNSHLEKSITEKAREIGKSTQEVVEDLLQKALPAKKEGLIYQKLDPQAFGYIINSDVEFKLPMDENVSLFADVDDTAMYAKNLRKKAWRK